MPTPKELKKLEKLAKVLDNGDVELLTMLDSLEEKVDTKLDEIESIATEALTISEEVKKMQGNKGNDGYTPVKGVDYIDGKDGENYILTDLDKLEIAKSIKVPIVEKVIEKITVKEIPIITNEIVKEINTVEVAVLDEAIVAYLEDKIETVNKLAKTTAKINSKMNDGIGLVVRQLQAGTGVTIDNTNQEYPIISASTGSGDVVGPASATDGVPALFNGTTGKLLKNSTPTGTGNPVMQTSPSLITPTLGVATATSINGATITSGTLNGSVTGTNTGDNATNTQYSGLATSKQDTLVSGTNIKTINGSSVLGSGDLVISGVSDGDKGDITVSGSGATWTIDNGVVTLAKQADMATASVVYRKTAGVGAPEVQTLATLKTDLGLTGTNTGDQTTIVGITGTKAQFDTAVTDGNFLFVGDVTSNATHTGDVTGSGALTIDPTAITGKTLVTAVGTDYVLVSDTSDAGNLKKALISDFSGAAANTFGTIAVSGQSDVVADSTTDTLTLAAGTNITITTNATTDTITINATGGGGGITLGAAIATSIGYNMV